MARWRVHEIAEPQGWSQRGLATAAGLAFGTVHAIWNNTATRADLRTLEALARVLKVEPGELIGSGEQVKQEEDRQV